MDKFSLLEKRDIDGYENFALFNYLNGVACVTDFAIVSGTFEFINIDNVRASFYWINESSELDYSKAYTVNSNGILQLLCKKDKNYAGLRVFGKCSDIKKYLVGEMDVNKNLAVGEFGYFPKNVYTKDINYKKLIDTGIIFKLPILQNGMFDTFDTIDTLIFKNNDDYILKYANQKIFSDLSDNQTYLFKEDVVLKLEPIRIWIDKVHDTFLTQDVIMGGIAFKSGLDECEYDDYTESDIYRSLNIFEDNIERSMDLYDKSKIKSKKRK